MTKIFGLSNQNDRVPGNCFSLWVEQMRGGGRAENLEFRAVGKGGYINVRVSSV